MCGVASDNQAAVDAADTVLLALRAADAPAVLGALTFRPHRRVISVMPSPDVAAISRLLGPVAEVSLGKPAVSVANRAGLTPVFPPGGAADELFDRLGSTLPVATEQVLDATSVASATVAVYFAYLTTISGWVTAQGLPPEHPRRMAGPFSPG